MAAPQWEAPIDKILIAGTGALATLFAARLSRARVEVTMLGSWEAALNALNKHGARLQQPDGRVLSGPVRAVRSPKSAGQHTIALVLVKSWQTARVAQQLAGCLAEQGVALTLQNGLGTDEILAQVLGGPRTAAGVTTTGAALLEPGLVKNGGAGSLELGEHPRVAPLVELLRTAGFTVNLHADVGALQWGKLVVNAAINPLTALYGVPNGALLEDAHLRDLMQKTALETAAVALACGVQLPYADPVLQVEQVARRTAANRSSMLQDLERGAPTEIEAINGAVVRAAETAGVRAPYNQALVAHIQARLHPEKHLPVKIQAMIEG